MSKYFVIRSLLLVLYSIHQTTAAYQEIFELRLETAVPRTKLGQNVLYIYPDTIRYKVTVPSAEFTIDLKKKYGQTLSSPEASGNIRFIVPERNRQFAVYEDDNGKTSLSLRCDSRTDLCLLSGALQTGGKIWRITPVEQDLYRYYAIQVNSDYTVATERTILEAKQWIKNDFFHALPKFNSRDTKHHIIKKRQATVTSECNIVEVVAIADNLVWEVFLDLQNRNPVLAEASLLQHYDTLFSEVDMRYAMVETTCIRVLLIAVEIQPTADLSWSVARTGNLVDGRAGAIACGLDIFGGADVAACFTKGDIAFDGDSEPSDVTYFDTMCVATDTVPAGTVTAFAAEDDHQTLARDCAQLILFLFGIESDSQIGGDDADGFISGSSIPPSSLANFDHPFLFSPEAEALLAVATGELDDDGTNCLKVGLVTDAELDSITASRELAGETISLLDQCQAAFGVDSQPCLPPGTPSIIETENICALGVFCSVDGACVDRTAVYNGSPCGCGQSCYMGSCEKESNSTLGENCRDNCNCIDPLALCVRQPDGSGICTCKYGPPDPLTGNCLDCEISSDEGCGYPEIPPFGVYSLDDGTDDLGSTATLICHYGYTTSQTVTIVCTSAGWSNASEDCTLKDCGPTFVVDNGRYIPYQGSLVGAVAVLECEESYKADGIETCITCGRDGNWTEASAECIKDCGKVPYTDYGWFKQDTSYTTLGATASLQCYDGYMTMYTVTITCEEYGWSNYSMGCQLKDCGPTPMVDYGQYTAYYGSLVGAIAVLECDYSYKANGTDTCITCGWDGYWTEASAECIKDCGKVPYTDYGWFKQDTSNTTLGATASLQCYDGYMTMYTVTITCEEYGWSNYSMGCQLKDCGPTPMVDYGQYMTYYGSLVGAIAVLECDYSYKANGTDTCITCGWDGYWTEASAECIKDCGKVPYTDYGWFKQDTSYTTLGATASLQCYDGYMTMYTVTITCEEYGWSNYSMGCQLKDCGSTPMVDYGQYTTYYGSLVGAIAVLECEYSYKANGTDTCITCGWDGYWTEASAECIKDCGKVPYTDYGWFKQDTSYTTLGATASLQCYDGYMTMYPVTITCEEYGWSNYSMGCQLKDCGSTPMVDYGQYTTYYGSLVGAIAVLECEYSYKANGTDTCITCGWDGYWTEASAECIKDCGKVPYTDYGWFKQDTSYTTLGATASLQCCDGYMTMYTVTITCEDDGWGNYSMGCQIKDCEAPPNVTYGYYMAYEGTLYGAVAILMCEENYSANSTDTSIICGSDGYWGVPKAECIRDCGRVPEIDNGWYVLDSEETIEGATATLKCCDGYSATSMTPVSITCDKMGWSDPSVLCQINNCTVPDIEHGYYEQQDGDTVGTRAILVCDSGYATTSDDTCIVCQKDGTYSKATATCATDCGLPPSISNGYYKLNSTDTTLGAVCDLICCDGHITNRSATITCEEDGWSHGYDTCISCPNDWTLEGESCYFIDSSSEFFRSQAKAVCEFAHMDLGSRLIILETAEEQTFAQGLIAAFTPQPTFGAWIDAIQDNINGQEIWESTGELVDQQLADWSAGPPPQPDDNNGATRESGTLLWKDDNYQWVDVQAANQFVSEANVETGYAFCEIELFN